jgi:2-hydroxychromene-2-carboxylate isomerase
MTDDAITRSGTGRRQLRWSDLERVKLRYYSTRRNRSGGWMTLKLNGKRSVIAIDSNIDGFDAIAARAARALADNRIGADDVTLANLAALGLTAPAYEAPVGSVELPR